MVASCNGLIRGVEKASGQVIWKNDSAQGVGRQEFHGAPHWGENTLYLGSDDRGPSGAGHVFAINPQTGALRWKTRVGRGFPSQFVPSLGRLCGVTLDDEPTCLDPVSGKVVWSVKIAEKPGSSLMPTGLLKTRGLLVHGDREGTVSAFDERSGGEMWRVSLGSRVTSNPVTPADGEILIGTADKRLHRLRTTDGGIVAATTLTGVPVRQPLVVGETVVIFVAISSEGAELHAYSVKSGTRLWSRTSASGGGWGSASPVLQQDVVWVGSDRGEVAAVSLKDGSISQTFKVDGPVAGIGFEGDLLFVGMTSGRVQAIRRPTSEGVGEEPDLHPSISRDGSRMVFASYRRAQGKFAEKPDANPWYAAPLRWTAAPQVRP